MTTVDSKGRIVLPLEIRESLGLTPGSEVEVRNENGKAVVEPEDDPEEIIARMEALIEEAAAEREPVAYDELDVYGKDHADTIRRQARKATRDDE